jgi:hypothetical protein
MAKLIIELAVIVVSERSVDCLRPSHVGWNWATKRNHTVKSVGSRPS